MERVKNLRSAIVPGLISGGIDEAERARRWRHLTDCYYAQQFSQYPRRYLTPESPPEHLLETVQALWEDLTDEYPVLGPWRLVLEVGPAIDVAPERVRTDSDPLLKQLQKTLQAMLEREIEEHQPAGREQRHDRRRTATPRSLESSLSES